MDLRATAIAAVLICMLVSPPLASAQTLPDPPAPPPATSETFPALLAPVAFALPWQCGACAGAAPLEPLPEPEIVWHDMGSWFAWLGAQLWNRVAYPLICWLLAIMQALFNTVAWAVNLAIAGVNALWRLGMLALAWSRDSVVSAWRTAEWFTVWAWSIWAWSIDLQLQLDAWIRLAGELLALAGALLAELWRVVAGASQGLIYLIGLFLALAPGVVTAVFDPVAPAQLTGLESNWFFLMFRDTLRGIQDSSLGWAWLGFVGLFYARFVLWLVDELGMVNS